MQHDNQSIHLSCPSTSGFGSLGHGNASNRIDNAIQVLLIMVSSLPFYALHADTFFARRITWNRDSLISQALSFSASSANLLCRLPMSSSHKPSVSFCHASNEARHFHFPHCDILGASAKLYILSKSSSRPHPQTKTPYQPN